jgi:hypothetical protein
VSIKLAEDETIGRKAAGNIQLEALQAILGMFGKASTYPEVFKYVYAVVLCTRYCYDALLLALVKSTNADQNNGKRANANNTGVLDAWAIIHESARQARGGCSRVSKYQTRYM